MERAGVQSVEAGGRGGKDSAGEGWMERAGVERIVLGRAGWRGQGWRG